MMKTLRWMGSIALQVEDDEANFVFEGHVLKDMEVTLVGSVGA